MKNIENITAKAMEFSLKFYSNSTWLKEIKSKKGIYSSQLKLKKEKKEKMILDLMESRLDIMVINRRLYITHQRIFLDPL
jgi:hypothetical protein